jgi:hypothetical protein
MTTTPTPTPASPPHPRPKLVATDLDGTLLHSDGSLSQRTRAALTAASKAGIRIALVTGRPPRCVPARLETIGRHYVIAANGAALYAPDATTIHISPIRSDTATELVTRLLAFNPTADRSGSGLHAVTVETSACGTVPPGPGQAGDPGSSGSSNSGTAAKCMLGGAEVPCHRDDLGWFSSLDDCYWRLMDPQPASDDPLNKTANGYPSSGDASKGKFYIVTCPDLPGQNRTMQGGDFWRATPPPGFGGGPNLAALAQEAVTKMRLEGAKVGIAPKPSSKGGSVGLPVWVWNQKGPRTTGPTSASATALGVTVTATAIVQNVTWDFGNGTTINCGFPGAPYTASFGTQVPDKGQGQCGFAGYTQIGPYTVAATSTWAVHWIGGGQQGDLTTTRASQVQIRIGEVQVVGQ